MCSPTTPPSYSIRVWGTAVPTVDQSFEHAVAPEVALPAPRPRRRWPPLFVVAAGALMVVVLVLAGIGPLTAHDAARDVSVNSALLSPSSSHPLGTDALGRDVLARLVV